MFASTQTIARYGEPMSKKRPKVSAPTKRALIAEAGGKCANPGCANRLTEFHHIKEWHIHKSHDPAHMICLCPSCHDAVTRGTLRITDEDAYRWKSIKRLSGSSTAHLYVEPGGPAQILTGSITLRGNTQTGLLVFNADPEHSLSFAVSGNDIMSLNTKITASDGTVIAEVVNGHARTKAKGVDMQVRPGRILIPGGLNSPHTLEWVRETIATTSAFGRTSDLPWLDLEVIAPNTVRVQGLWVDAEMGFVIDSKQLMSVQKWKKYPRPIRGAGLETILDFGGLVDGVSAFGIGIAK